MGTLAGGIVGNKTQVDIHYAYVLELDTIPYHQIKMYFIHNVSKGLKYILNLI